MFFTEAVTHIIIFENCVRSLDEVVTCFIIQTLHTLLKLIVHPQEGILLRNCGENDSSLFGPLWYESPTRESSLNSVLFHVSGELGMCTLENVKYPTIIQRTAIDDVLQSHLGDELLLCRLFVLTYRLLFQLPISLFGEHRIQYLLVFHNV